MRYRDEKGITGIDMTVAILVITIFISLIATIFYNLNLNSKKIERRAIATEYAIQTIETIKKQGYKYINMEENGTIGNFTGNIDKDGTSFYQLAEIKDYADIMTENGQTGKQKNLVKQVTVTELSAIITKD